MPRGRDKELIRRRNDALVRRYNYWTEVERLRFDDALKQLSLNEFFLSEERIMAILRRAAPYASVTPASAKIKAPRINASRLALFKGE